MTERHDDVWASRDFPVLVEITRLVDRGGYSIDPFTLVRSTGMDTPEVTRAVHALERRGLVQVEWGEANFWVTNVTGAAYLMTGLHPDGDDAVSRLIAAIHQAADRVDDPDEKSRLRRVADSVLSVGREVFADVMASVITKTTLGA